MGTIFASVATFFAGKPWLWIVALAGLLLGGVAIYFVWSQDNIADLQKEVAQSRMELAQQRAVITDMQAQAARNAKLAEEFNKNVAVIRDQSSQLVKKLNSIDLSKKAASDPSAVQKKVNEETKKFFDSIDTLTRQD
jgi:type II secretory pathway pseudopilin PulG